VKKCFWAVGGALPVPSVWGERVPEGWNWSPSRSLRWTRIAKQPLNLPLPTISLCAFCAFYAWWIYFLQSVFFCLVHVCSCLFKVKLLQTFAVSGGSPLGLWVWLTASLLCPSMRPLQVLLLLSSLLPKAVPLDVWHVPCFFGVFVMISVQHVPTPSP